MLNVKLPSWALDVTELMVNLTGFLVASGVSVLLPRLSSKHMRSRCRDDGDDNAVRLRRGCQANERRKDTRELMHERQGVAHGDVASTHLEPNQIDCTEDGRGSKIGAGAA